MKRRDLFASLGALPLAAMGQAREGTHGMALFGGLEGLYASHLPMFHTPHDVQAVLRLSAVDVRIDKRLRQALHAKPELWTLDPERFDLSRLQPGHAAPLTQFRARAVQGHFERGGVERLADPLFTVKEVLLFETLDPMTRRADEQRFLCFGQGRERFLVKRLDQRPDIDLIGRWSEARALAARRFELRLPSPGVAAPAPQTLLQALRAHGAQPRTAVQWLYVETGDLA